VTNRPVTRRPATPLPATRPATTDDRTRHLRQLLRALPGVLLVVVTSFGLAQPASASAATDGSPSPATTCTSSRGTFVDGVSFWSCSWKSRGPLPADRVTPRVTPACPSGKVYVWSSEAVPSDWTTYAECSYQSALDALTYCRATDNYFSSFAINRDSWQCALQAPFPVAGFVPKLAAACADRGAVFTERQFDDLRPYYLCQGAS
jgi:hypothetical protein